MNRRYGIIGGIIRRARRALDMTQQELADRLSISVQSVSQWENGRTKPDEGRFSQLAGILNVDAKEFEIGDQDKIDESSFAIPTSLAKNLLDRYAIPIDDLVYPFEEIPGLIGYGDLREGSRIAKFSGKGRLYLYQVMDNSFDPELRRGDELILDSLAVMHIGSFGLFVDWSTEKSFLAQVRRLGLNEEERLVADVRLAAGSSSPQMSLLIEGKSAGLVGVAIELIRPLSRDMK